MGYIALHAPAVVQSRDFALLEKEGSAAAAAAKDALALGAAGGLGLGPAGDLHRELRALLDGVARYACLDAPFARVSRRADGMF